MRPASAAASRSTSRRLPGSDVRTLAIGIAIAVIVYVATGGHVIFLPLLFLPLGLFTFGNRRRARSRRW